MSSYRRLISYIYAYEGKKKGKNIGFVKLEAKDGQCKLSVNVKKIYVEGNDIGVYLLGKEGQETFLSNIFIRSGCGEFRTVLDSVNVMGTGNSLDTYYGLTIHDVKNSWRSYTTIWEDSVTHMAQDALPGTGDKSVPAKKAVSSVVKEIESEIAREEHRREEEMMQTKAADVGISSAAEMPERESAPEIVLYSDRKENELIRTGKNGRNGRPPEGGMVRQGPPQDRTEQDSVPETVIVNFSRKKQNQVRPGNQTVQRSGANPDLNPGLQTKQQQDPKAEAKRENTAEISGGAQPGANPGGKPGVQPGMNPRRQPGPQQGANPGKSLRAQPGMNPRRQPGPQQGANPGGSLRAQPGMNPGGKPGPQPGMNPRRQPGPQPGANPGGKPGTQPGVFPSFFLPNGISSSPTEAKPESKQLQETAVPVSQGVHEEVHAVKFHQNPELPQGIGIPSESEETSGLGGRATPSAAEAFLIETQPSARQSGQMTAPGRPQMSNRPQHAGQTLQSNLPETGKLNAYQPVAEYQVQQESRSGQEEQNYQPQMADGMISPELENPEVLQYLQETEELTQNPEKLWEVLNKNYPKIQPFDYDEGCEILTIRPQDIGRLPREVWVYGNNSFLLHGYYNFRYLILVRLGSAKGKPRYLLGIPGHYYSNEKYMASMFGFPNFVLSKKQPSNDGRFGYWYTDIKMG